MKIYKKNKVLLSVNKKNSNKFSSVNIITNMIGYFCKNGQKHIFETKFKNILFIRATSKKKSIKIATCLNTFIKSTLPYIKVKPKKSRNRRKIKKALLVYPITRNTSKRKAYMNFSSTFKGLKQLNKPFIFRLEAELESIYTHINKRVSGLNKYVLTEKRNNLHKSAFKYIPYYWKKNKKRRSKYGIKLIKK